MTSLNYSVTDNWGHGFVGTMILGAGGSALDGWTVEFDAAFDITHIWNAEIVSHVGNHYVVRNVAWNGTVNGGTETSFGFQAVIEAGGTDVGGLIVNGAVVGSEPLPDLPMLSINDASIAEGNSGTTDLNFTVSLSHAASGAVTVAYGTEGGTASAGSDFAAAGGTLTFAPGETSKTITVRVNGDTAIETNETFNLKLGAASGAGIADAIGLGTIRNDDSAPGQHAGGGALSTSGNQIVDAAGNSVQIAGVNWFGLESGNFAPHGLWTRGYQDMMNQMVDLGFNTIRLPFSTELLHTSAAPNGIDFSQNADLQGLSGLQVMDRIIDYAGEIGLRVILDHHRSDAGAGTSANGLWYDAAHPEAQWIADWQMLANRYADKPAVIGADLHNEPHAGTWGGGGGNDWAAAAERAGNAIGAVNSNWLIFVEGVGDYQGNGYWWGGNLMGVKDRPIQLDVANKLVYSAHDYPNSVYPQPWFQGADFAENLPAKFQQMWGYIYEQNIAPVYIGEFGTKLTDPKDAPWLEKLTAYLAGDLDGNGTRDIPAGDLGPSWTYWSWNPNSGDTGGILQADWRTVEEAKMAFLRDIEFEFGSGAEPAGMTLAGTAGADTLHGAAGADHLDGKGGSDTLYGEAGDDTLVGDGGHDWLDGGSGADTMSGGAGNDSFVVDDPHDVVIEAAGGGYDQVLTAVSYALSDDSEIEKLRTTNNDGKAAIDLTGNSLANVLIGNKGSNRINGGAGADHMDGRGGNDTYIVDNAGDVIVEAEGGGNDQILASVSYTLGDGVAVEKLRTISNSGTSPFALTGNNLANTLIGNDGANRLEGRGGQDVLTGLGGRDIFVFRDGDGADKVTDFTDTVDRLDISGFGYHSLAEMVAAGGSIQASGADTVVHFDGAGDQVLLLNMLASKVTAADFIFA